MLTERRMSGLPVQVLTERSALSVQMLKKVCFASSDVNRMMSDLTIQMLTENCLSVLPVHILIERCMFSLATRKQKIVCLFACPHSDRKMSVLSAHMLY